MPARAGGVREEPVRGRRERELRNEANTVYAGANESPILD
jgi:hypothetical protein